MPTTTNSCSPNFYLLNTFNISSLLEPSTVNHKPQPQQHQNNSDDINNNINTKPSTTSTAKLSNNSSDHEKQLPQNSTSTGNKKFSYLGDLLDEDANNPRSSLDPFHDMELKTINDLEELKSILANQQRQQQEEQQIHEQKQNAPITNNNNSMMLMDSFGLPKISFFDLDLNKS